MWLGGERRLEKHSAGTHGRKAQFTAPLAIAQNENGWGFRGPPGSLGCSCCPEEPGLSSANRAAIDLEPIVAPDLAPTPGLEELRRRPGRK